MNYVEPIRNLKSIKALKAYLKDNKRPRDYLLFTLGINIALRIGDLLKLKVGAVAERDGDGWRIRDELRTIEGKTSKRRIMQLNDSAREAVQFWLDAHDDAAETDYLFASQKHMDRPITSGQAWRLAKEWAAVVGLEGNIGTHSLRKTFGYWAWKNGTRTETLQELFGHSRPEITRRYIGVSEREIQDVYNNVNL